MLQWNGHFSLGRETEVAGGARDWWSGLFGPDGWHLQASGLIGGLGANNGGEWDQKLDTIQKIVNL